MKEKLTLFLALSFVIGLTLYQHNRTSDNDNGNDTTVKLPVKDIVEDVVKEQPAYTESEESRAQKYIDRTWAADKTLNETAYRTLGGTYTDYWDHQIANTVTDEKAKNQTPDKDDSTPSMQTKLDLVENTNNIK